MSVHAADSIIFSTLEMHLDLPNEVVQICVHVLCNPSEKNTCISDHVRCHKKPPMQCLLQKHLFWENPPTEF